MVGRCSSEPAISFNPRPRAGGDPLAAAAAALNRSFNPRPRAGGDWPRRALPPGRAGSFNPRPRAGGDTLREPIPNSATPVSIRAPARGATAVRPSERPVMWFQSAPPRGGRPQWPPGSATARGVFQSAPPRGGRPARRPVPAARSRRFNPRPRAGGDQASAVWTCSGPELFQSAPPRGGRLQPGILSAVRPQPVSIRAPARGATHLVREIGNDQYVSIRAPARGATGTYS